MQHRSDKEYLKQVVKLWRNNLDFWMLMGMACLSSIIIASSFEGIGIYAFLAPGIIVIITLLSQIPALKYAHQGFTFSDFFSCSFIGLIALLGAYIRFFNHITLPLVLIALFYTNPNDNLTREHFYYSYTPEGKNITDLINFILLSFVIILPLSILVGFIDLENFRLADVTALEVFYNTVVWAFFVGISEEVIFRVFLLIILADMLSLIKMNKLESGKKPGPIEAKPKFMALLLSAAIFGIAHATKGWNYALLAFIAGFAYGFLFLKHRNLFGPIMMHMTIDVIAVTFFGAVL